MADLKPLIRVRKHAVEQKQKFLAELYRQAEQLQSEKDKYLLQLKTERVAIEGTDSVETLGDYARFEKAVRMRVGQIDVAVAKLETRINIAREDMREAFSELKKIEITQRRREEEAQAEIDKKQAQELDEIGIEGFRRKED